MIIRRDTLKAVLPATGSETIRGYALTHVQIEPSGRVVATNGHILLIATDKRPMADGDFPTAGDVPAFHASPTTPILLERTAADKLIKATGTRTVIPILTAIQVSTNGDGTTCCATDLASAMTIRIPPADVQSRGAFPSYERVLPPADQPTLRVAFGADLLLALCKAAKAVKPRGGETGPVIEFRLPLPAPPAEGGDTVPVQYQAVRSAVGVSIIGDDIDVTGCLMPIRM